MTSRGSVPNARRPIAWRWWSRADYARLRGQAFAALASSLNQSPESVVNALSDQCPFVLLPVRIETSFAPSPTGPTLRVRFYPDDISLAPPIAPVSTDEVGLGRAYWKKRAASRHAPGNQTARRAYETAWTTLAARSGAYRAGWVVRATAPTNPDAAPNDLHFTDPAPPPEPAVSRAALLPDRFVVIGFVADPTTQALRPVVEGVGAPIPDDLVIAPDPGQAETFLTRDDGTGRLIVPDALKWMVDYDAAVSVGMAMTIWLSPPVRHAGIRSSRRGRRSRGHGSRGRARRRADAARETPVRARLRDSALGHADEQHRHPERLAATLIGRRGALRARGFTARSHTPKGTARDRPMAGAPVSSSASTRSSPAACRTPRAPT